MGNQSKAGGVGPRLFTERTTREQYQAVITDESHRIALNGLTQECIQEARAQKERLRFSSKGVDALGSAKRFVALRNQYGIHDKRTVAADRVFEADIVTGLFEESENVFSFLVSYPVEDGNIIMGELTWDELAARGALDDRTEQWYQQRSFAEAREAIAAGEMLRSGELHTNDIVTISNTATASNAGEYFSGEDLMIRRISLNQQTGMVEIDQLMMKHMSNSIIEKLFAVLDVPVDERTFYNSDDQSVKYLASQIRVKKGELQNGAADIGFLLDYVLNEQTGKHHIFGREVDGVIGNPYARIAEVSRQKEVRRREATDFLKDRFITFAQSGRVTPEQLKAAYEDARSIVADIEGSQFVEDRYGKAAAQQHQRKQLAVASGDMAGALQAERTMQAHMGDVIVCNTVLGNKTGENASSGNVFSLFDALLCVRLPKPGEMANCPCCRKYVRVEGTEAKIFCPNTKCQLRNPKKHSKNTTQKQSPESSLSLFGRKKVPKKKVQTGAKHEKIAS